MMRSDQTQFPYNLRMHCNHPCKCMLSNISPPYIGQAGDDNGHYVWERRWMCVMRRRNPI